jgi:hypothetical protein
MAQGRDRRAKLLAQSAVNGIDFVEVLNPAQTQLRVHFANPQPGVATLQTRVTGATISGGEAIPSVPVVPLLAWGTDAAGRPALDLTVAAPGDFSTYTLRLVTSAPVLDPFFDHVEFTFKAGCPSTIDCEATGPEPPLLPDPAPPIDYLAKDFQSFRKALLAFSALRYPGWQERSEADFGVMFMEALASLADDLSYRQDRIAAEGFLETATERRSLVRLARLVDYDPPVATASRVLLELQMAGAGPVPAGLAVSAQATDGPRVDFETGTGIDDMSTYPAWPEWNALRPYFWDDTGQVLPRGTTEMWLESPGVALAAGQLLLIDTTADPEADPPLREVVKLVSVDAPVTDPLYAVQVVRVAWSEDEALTVEHDLLRTRVGANLVPATQGRRWTERFVASRQPWTSPLGTSRALVRTGAGGTFQFLHTLRNAPLAWLAQADPLELPRPEIRLAEVSSRGTVWRWFRSLLDPSPAQEIFTVDPVRYRPIDPLAGTAEYDGDGGDTIRFGDGTFGAVPAPEAVFEVTYRSGGGARGNVAAGAIDHVDLKDATAMQIASVTNPLAAEGGRDAEALDRIREMAPQAFRAAQYRAVRAEDYERAAATLPWVQRAGTTFRYTGSWLTVFTAADPKGMESVPPGLDADLTSLLNRYRLAGYESFTVATRFASLDLDIVICVRPNAFRADVKEAVRAALDASRHPDGSSGFFHPDRFTFGVALERSAIEAAVEEVPGVDGVIDVRYRRRGHTPGFVKMPDFVPVAPDEIVRVDGDPNRPEHGSLHIETMGGK